MPPMGFPRQLLDRPTSERLAYFRSYAIAHPRLTIVSDALRRAIQEPTGCSLILVIGPTGVGKTTLRLRIEQELKGRFLTAGEADPGRIPVVGIEAVAPDSGNFSWKDYYRRALQALEEPLIDQKIDYPTRYGSRNQSGELTIASRVGSPELRQAMEQALRHRRPAAVLIDEARPLQVLVGQGGLLEQAGPLVCAGAARLDGGVVQRGDGEDQGGPKATGRGTGTAQHGHLATPLKPGKATAPPPGSGRLGLPR